MPSLPDLAQYDYPSPQRAAASDTPARYPPRGASHPGTECSGHSVPGTPRIGSRADTRRCAMQIKSNGHQQPTHSPQPMHTPELTPELTHARLKPRLPCTHGRLPPQPSVHRPSAAHASAAHAHPFAHLLRLRGPLAPPPPPRSRLPVRSARTSSAQATPAASYHDALAGPAPSAPPPHFSDRQ
jgi:hypothetical protein